MPAEPRGGRDHPVVVRDAPTRRGPARVHAIAVPAPRGVVVLGHGAGGGVGAPDLQAVAGVAAARGLAVALAEQPYRVAGRRAPDRAHHLDACWADIVAFVRREAGWGDVPLVAGGRSSGARVACRTAAEVGAAGVLCLAFPVSPRPRRDGTVGPSRLPELDAVAVPALVVQGVRDPFGMPPPAAGRRVVEVRGDHSLRTALPAVRDAVAAWLDGLLPG